MKNADAKRGAADAATGETDADGWRLGIDVELGAANANLFGLGGAQWGGEGLLLLIGVFDGHGDSVSCGLANGS